MSTSSPRLLVAVLFISSLSLSTIPTSYASDETPRGEITARGCNAIAHRQTQTDTIPFTAKFGSNSYRMGEGLQLYITAEEDAYVTIIDQGSNPEEDRNEILLEDKELVAGEEKRFPPEGYKLAVKPPVGTNRFEILLSRKRMINNDTETSDNGRDVDLEKLPETKELPTRCIMSFEITQ